MSNILPESYIVQKFYEFGGFPKFMKGTHEYRASCPTCREGKSWGKKRRLNYIPEKNIIHCFNCNKTWNPINWIMEQSGLSYKEVMEESNEYDESTKLLPKNEKNVYRPPVPDLPEDSINLFDKQQVDFYKDNEIVKTALLYIKERRLDTAVNKPKALYISLTDFVHKNRLCIPFYDEEGNVVWYQTRTLLKKDEKDKPKYMSKMNSEKSVFGIERITTDLDYIFITEGPIDSMFIENGVAMAGINMTELQKSQISQFIFHKKIWILDNEKDTNKEVRRHMKELLESGERVFFWPDKFRGFKDINSICCKIRRDKINPDFFIDNSYEGDLGLIKLDK